MMKIIFTILILMFIVPLLISFGTAIAQIVSMVLMMLSVGLGTFVHRIFAGKPANQWQAPVFFGVAKTFIIVGFIYAVIANVIGGVFNWHWLLSIGSGLDHIFGVLLILDMLTLLVLSTIHGYFEILQTD